MIRTRAKQTVARYGMEWVDRPLSDAGDVVRDGYKRVFDLVVIGIAGVLLFPFWVILWIVIPVAIWLEDRGPIFYVQDRPGRGGALFRMFKFRTMKVHADTEGNLEEGIKFLTRVGSVLRVFHLDEIPQLINVVKGEMSLVGPRPEWIIRHRQFCRELPEFEQRLKVKPGIAGLAQVYGSYWSSPREKLRYDNLYIKTLSPLVDVKVLFLAVWVVVKRVIVSRGGGGGNPFFRSIKYPSPPDQKL